MRSAGSRQTNTRARGPGAVNWLAEQAELAAALEDKEAAETWRENGSEIDP